MSNDVYVLDAVRTPFGRYGGALAEFRPDDLAAHAVRSLLARSPELDPAAVEDVILGDANQSGEDNRNVARMAALLAGMPTSVPGSTVNRLCGSGLDAAIGASRAVAAGDASLMIAGGVESMSRAPWVLPKPERGYPRGHETLHSTTLGWRMVNPAMPERWTISLGESAEALADRYGISREAQDEFAVRSHRGAAAAWDAGVFSDEIVVVPGSDLTRDEGIRPDSSAEALARLKPVFRPQGTVTAGNASPLNDGSAALLIGDEAGAAAAGRTPLARIAGRGA
ncbi:MAG: acetyl-CoA C-acyltransferase, partial [Cryptosporangiaceae bacterium]|nr:acetyl-CoA C-acyltransferase [Cryptosporangiaceae bacterium]